MMTMMTMKKKTGNADTDDATDDTDDDDYDNDNYNNGYGNDDDDDSTCMPFPAFSMVPRIPPNRPYVVSTPRIFYGPVHPPKSALCGPVLVLYGKR